MQRRNPQIKPEEYEFIKAHAQRVSDIGLETDKSVRISHAGQTMQQVDLEGITANILSLSDIEVGSGRAISEEEVRRHAPVAFIGQDVSERFFSGQDPIGKTLGVDGVPYEVVGVAKAKGSVFGQSQDKFVMVPVYSYFKTYGNGLHNNDVALFAKAIDAQH